MRANGSMAGDVPHRPIKGLRLILHRAQGVAHVVKLLTGSSARDEQSSQTAHSVTEGLTRVPPTPYLSQGNLLSVTRHHNEGSIQMAEKGKGDKSKKEPQKKAVLSLKEKRKAKADKKNSK